MSGAEASAPVRPGFAEAVGVWARIGVLSFGGPAAQIALMHRIVVEERRWLREDEYLGALSFCMLLPGPEAMQLATFAGWRLHGVAGGLAAGLLFVAPGALVILALAGLYAAFGQAPLVEALFFGVKAAVIAIVLEALLRISRRALKTPAHWVIAGAAFLAIFAFALPYPLIVAAAALAGLALGAREAPDGPAVPADAPWRATLRTAVLWLGIWLVPLAALHLALGGGHVLAELGWFFSKLAVVTFGGAYAVLAWMAQEVVGARGWLTAGEMMDGLGLAETTPGPLILVTEFVGFLAAARESGLPPLLGGAAGAAVALWATFAPCFLWIFVGAPYVGWISSRRRLRAALSGVVAAVVGVILNLSLWFALHVVFEDVARQGVGAFRPWVPDLGTFDPAALGLAALSAVLLRLHWSIAATLGTAAALGALLFAAGWAPA